MDVSLHIGTGPAAQPFNPENIGRSNRPLFSYTDACRTATSAAGVARNVEAHIVVAHGVSGIYAYAWAYPCERCCNGVVFNGDVQYPGGIIACDHQDAVAVGLADGVVGDRHGQARGVGGKTTCKTRSASNSVGSQCVVRDHGIVVQDCGDGGIAEYIV